MDLAFQLSMTLLTCCRSDCGISFAVPGSWESEKRSDHSSWHCPNGHSQYFPGKSDTEKLRIELEAANNRLAGERARHDQTKAELETTERRRRAERGARTRILSRIASGVCPRCNRHFDALQRHMQSKHKES